MKVRFFNQLAQNSSFYKSLHKTYRKWKKRVPFLNLTTEEIFTKIYVDDLWGANKINESNIYSGDGSYGEHAKIYVDYLNDFISQHSINSITDVGCGDFAIGAQIAVQNPSLLYHGCDIVKYVIENNQRKYGSVQIKFYHMDGTKEVLPHADLLVIRQVLQHLSNKKIKLILKKISDYKYVIVTEHLFAKAYTKTYNKDKPTGPDTRLVDYSGVFIYRNPFNIPCEEVLSCRLDAYDKEAYLKSFLIVNR